jgi:uncharacterized protein YjbI with pentapeptide repeats
MADAQTGSHPGSWPVNTPAHPSLDPADLEALGSQATRLNQLLIGLLVSYGYVFVTNGTIHDAGLFTDQFSAQLPVFGVAVPSTTFYLWVPSILIASFIYFQLLADGYWQLVRRALALPGGRDVVEERLQGTILAPVLIPVGAPTRAGRTIQRRPILVYITCFLGWGAAPTCLLLMLGRVVKSHELGLESIHFSLTMLAEVLALVWFGRMQTLLGWTPRERGVTNWWAVVIVGAQFLFVIQLFATEGSFQLTRITGALYEYLPRLWWCDTALLILAILTRFRLAGRDSAAPHVKDGKERLAGYAALAACAAQLMLCPLAVFPGAVFAWAHGINGRFAGWWTAVSKGLLDYQPYPDLSGADLSVRPAGWVANDPTSMQLVRPFQLPEPRDLRHADARGAFLVRAQLNDASMPYIDLSHCDAREAQFGETDLQYANLDRANLNNAHLVNAQLSFANLESAILRNADLSGANLEYSRLTAADFRAGAKKGSGAEATDTWLGEDPHALLAPDADFLGADLTGVLGPGSVLERCNFQNTTLNRADLTHADMARADLSGVAGEAATLSQAELNHSVLDRADFSFARLDNADLNWSRADQLNLMFADLDGASLDYSAWGNCRLISCWFSPGSARHATFYNCLFQHADFRGARLAHSYFYNCYFSTDVPFDGADLTGCNFVGCHDGPPRPPEANAPDCIWDFELGGK